MKKLFVVFAFVLTACGSDPVSPVVNTPIKVVSTKTVTCTNGQSAPAATIEKGNRSFITVNYCVSKTVNGFDGVVTRSSLQMEQFVFDDQKAVWSMELAERVSSCMSANYGDPLCYYPYI